MPHWLTESAFGGVDLAARASIAVATFIQVDPGEWSNTGSGPMATGRTAYRTR